jgi:leucyl-tRNA synthetase
VEDFKKIDFKRIKKHAHKQRANQTDSEKLLWEEFRGRKLSGYKFLRQHPILYQGNLIRFNYFIADFYCSEKRWLSNLMVRFII